MADAQQSTTANNAPVVPVGDRFTKEIWTDGFTQVQMLNGAVKIDMVSLRPNGTDHPDAIVDHRIVMSLEQFLKSFEVLKQMCATLEKSGMIQNT